MYSDGIIPTGSRRIGEVVEQNVIEGAAGRSGERLAEIVGDVGIRTPDDLLEYVRGSDRGACYRETLQEKHRSVFMHQISS